MLSTLEEFFTCQDCNSVRIISWLACLTLKYTNLMISLVSEMGCWNVLSKLKITKWFSFLQSVLKRQLGQHPLIVLKDMKFCVLKSLIEFMYCGETSVTEENLNPLMEAAKFFEVSFFLLTIVEFITGYYWNIM